MSERNLKSRRNSQMRKVTLPRLLRLMKHMNEEAKKFGICHSLGLRKELTALDADIRSVNPKAMSSKSYKAFHNSFFPNKLSEVQATASKKDIVSPVEMKEIKKNVKNLTPPPLPEILQDPKETIRLLRIELDEAYKGIDEVSAMALQFKAEMMVERQENKLIMKTFNELIPAKIAEAVNLTVERVEQGRDLRKKQILHALDSKKNNDKVQEQ